MLHQGLNQNLACAEMELDGTLFVFYSVLDSLCYKNSKEGNQLRFISIFKLSFSVTTGLSSCTKISNVTFFSVLMEYTEETMRFYPAKSGILQSPSCVCLFVCLFVFFVSRISHKLLVGF